MESEIVADAIELELLTGSAQARPMSWIRSSSFAASTANETDLNLAVSTISRRAQLLGDRYPIEVRNSGLKIRLDASIGVYETMLLITSRIPAITFPQSALADSAELFEHIVAHAALTLLGPGSRVVRFGFPGDPGRPPEFPQAIPWLVDKMGLKGGTAYRDPQRKDGGVDVVAWRPFPDGRPGFPIHLIQVTLERNFSHKASDINTRLWSLLLGLDVDPAAVLAIPRSIPEDKRWAEVATRAIILDRVRIAGLTPPALTVLSESRWTSVTTSLIEDYRRQVGDLQG